MPDTRDLVEPAPSRTRWNIRRDGKLVADFESAKGRSFVVGDRVNLPPPLPRGSIWTIVAVEPAETTGFNGTLVLEQSDARAQ